MKQILLFLFVMFSVSLLNLKASEMKAVNQTVVDIVVESESHTTLEAAVVAAGLVETLQGDGPFTVFAPTDAAFEALPEGTLDALLAEPGGQLTDILLYHVVAAKAMSGSLMDGQKIETVLGQNLTVTASTEGVFINGAEVTVADIEATNGVVHVIDAVLLPTTKTVVDIVVKSESHTTLEAAVVAAGLVETLQGDGPFTVFAPTDAAFDALPEGTLDALLAEPGGQLTDILLYHVVAAKAMSGSLMDGQKIETVLGQNLTVTVSNEGVFINGAEVIVADIEATNGVVHVIDAVLLPTTKTVVDIVVESESHTTLEAAVVAAGLVETLQGDGPFTVFAPTDAAFEALPEGTLDALLAEPGGQLTDILLYHVVAAKAMSGSLMDGQKIETVLGKDIRIRIESDGVFINDAEVTVADIEATNGVVHVIDAVLLPSNEVKLMEDTRHGKILTDAFGYTLYFFTKDADGSSFCDDGCLANWPVFYARDMDYSNELDSADFSSIDRGDGAMQTTYKGWPLYYFVKDSLPGQVMGDGVIGKWFVAKPDYTIMLVDDQLTGNDNVDYKGDYNPGSEMTQYFSDDKGATLYTWIQDNYNKNNFTDSEFAKNAIWPIYEEEEVVVPSVLDPADFTIIDVYGKRQLAYKGWPLYYFGQDMMMRGDNKGVSVPSPGVWPVAVKDMMTAKYGTVVDIVVESESHTTLEAAVVAAELVETLQGDGPFTVFAPTDAAFEALPEGTLDALLAEPGGQLTDILLYHVVAAKAMSGSLMDGQKIETVLGQNLTVTASSEGVFINGAEVTVADIEATNGVVHVIDAVLLPTTKTVVDIVVESESHTTLEAAVVAAELVETLQGDGPFTVFAPTDAAFEALPEGTLDALLAEPGGQLTDILLYHVVAAKAMSGSLMDGQKIETVLGQNLTVTASTEGVFINGAEVTVADIEATNGVVHVIDAVLLPTTKTVVDIVVKSESHTTLEAAVVAAGLVETLQGDGPFTVFAPTDAAFDALPEGTLDALLAEPGGQLTDILLYHVVAAKAMSGSLMDGQKIETVLGQNLTVTVSNEGVFINGAEVIVADIEATNGVVHVIDAVLLPTTKTVVDIVVESESHTTLEAAVVAAGLVETLQGDGPFTVFAPTDAAFEDLLAELGYTSLDEIDAATLEAVLLMHVVPGKVMAGDLSDGFMAQTLQQEEIVINLNGGASITDPNSRVSQITGTDLEAVNGVVHVIDKVILPDLTTTSVNSIMKSDLKIFPNPVDDVLNIQTTEPSAFIKIISLTGKTVLQRAVMSSNERIDVQSFTPGVYIVLMESERAAITRKIVVR
ncbi:fasciclin domain-containing protein [uncultured Draconibacterium sp.]|uniref:fasciclin domain-containing protein n=1 Tax=uncultured Draconibacterium sp. TaxID=1573823 RepID=UPI0025F590E8|nr:fasciclin domain-containing protein [uncultured Draconibacterium sp.]